VSIFMRSDTSVRHKSGLRITGIQDDTCAVNPWMNESQLAHMSDLHSWRRCVPSKTGQANNFLEHVSKQI
jgi:hypothetical protein